MNRLVLWLLFCFQSSFIIFLRRLFHSTLVIVICQVFFLFLFYFLVKQSGEGGIRTLAPVNPTYTLSRGTSSANLSTSPNKTIFIYVLSLGQDISYQTLFLMSSIFN